VPGAGYYCSIPGAGLCNPPQGAQLRASSTGKGYWILTKDGGMWTFGDAKYFGGAGGVRTVDMAVRR
jgi:hypothetical protein